MYDPRGYLKKAETGMKERVIEAIKDLRGEGTTLGKKFFILFINLKWVIAG